MNKGYRHGEIAIIEIEKLPEGLTESKSKTFMVGSHGNSHGIDKGTLYLLEKPQEDFTFGYLVAKNTNLTHPEHQDKKGKAPIADGIYKLVKQQEYTPEGLIPIVD